MGIKIPKLPSIPKIPSLPNPADGPVGTLCRKMESKLDVGLDEMGKVRNTTWNSLNSLKGALGDLVGKVTTPAGDMAGALGDLNNTAKDSMPSFPVGLDQIKDMLQKCGILEQELPSLSGSALLGDFQKDIGLDFDFSMDDFFGSIDIPEFGIAKMLDDLSDNLDFFDLSGILSGLDGYLNCLDSMCGSNVSDKVDHANYIVDDMKLTADGALDVDGLMTDAGVPMDKINNIKSVQDATAENKYDLKQSTQNAGDSFVDSLKQYKDELFGSVSPSISIA